MISILGFQCVDLNSLSMDLLQGHTVAKVFNLNDPDKFSRVELKCCNHTEK